MKIGLSCCGSGPGVEYSHVLAETLEEMSIHLEMISCCSLSSVPMFFWSRGIKKDDIEQRVKRLLSAQEIDQKMKDFCKNIGETAKTRIAISGVDCNTGGAVIWADGLHSEAWNWKTQPLKGAEWAALECAISTLPCVSSRETQKLNDFAYCYGCPFFPLRMAGVERILSVAFTGGKGIMEHVGEALSAVSGRNADLHYNLKFSAQDRPESLKTFLTSQQSQIYEKLLF